MAFNRWFSKLGVFVLCAAFIIMGTRTAGLAAQSASEAITLQFINHIQAGLPEQDVFVETEDGMVERVTGDAPLSAIGQMAYSTAMTEEHDPFMLGETPLGSFERGDSLGFTLGQWLGASGTGTYDVNGDSAQLDLAFRGLVPNGLYTVWCSRLTFPPNAAVVDTPCGAEDGSQNVFTADESGAAQFNMELASLEESTAETATVIALAYHSDGKTYGANPGDFGSHSHVHIFALLPVPTA